MKDSFLNDDILPAEYKQISGFLVYLLKRFIPLTTDEKPLNGISFMPQAFLLAVHTLLNP